MGKFKPFQHDEMVAAGKAKPYSRSDYKTKEMQENAKGGGGGGESDVVYVPITVDYDGDEPTVTCEATYNQLKSYIDAGKIVYLKESFDNGYLLYNMAGYNHGYQQISWSRIAGYSPITYISIAIEENEWACSVASVQYV